MAQSSGTMGILALLGIAGGGVVAYLLFNKQEPLHGALGEPITCSDGSVVYQKIYDRNQHAWLPYQTEADCPIEPLDGTPDPTSGVSCPANQTGPNGESVVYTRVWSSALHRYVTDPNALCEPIDGLLSNPVLCPNGQYLSLQMYSRQSHSWVPYQSCQTTPPPATCRETHPGSVCQDNYVWDCENEVWVNTGVYCGIGPLVYDDFETGVLQTTKWTLNGNLPTVSNLHVHDGLYAARTLSLATGISGLWALDAARVPTLGITPANTEIAVDLWVYINALPVNVGTSRSEVIIRLDDASVSANESSGPHVDLAIDAMYARWDLRVDTFVGGVRTTTYFDTGIPWVAGQWTHIMINVSNPGSASATVSGTIDGIAFSTPSLAGSLNSPTQYLNTLALITFASGDCFWDEINVTVV